MTLPESETPAVPAANPWAGVDVSEIMRQRGWWGEAAGPEFDAWAAYAAALLGVHAADRIALEELIGLVVHYDAAEILMLSESHTVLARAGAREVLRGLANLVLDGPEIDSDRFKEIVSGLKESLPYRGRKLFHPIRLALAGRAGEGELDRVILLLDAAAKLPGCTAVKGARQRMLEFCAALD